MAVKTGSSFGAALLAALSYAALWGGSTAYLFTRGNEDWFTAAFVFAVFGIALSSLAWLLTRGAEAAPVAVKRPAIESVAVIGYLLVYAIGFLGFGMTAARAAFPEGPAEEVLVMGVKLVAHVILPALLLLMLGAKLSPLIQARLRGRWFWRTLLVLGALILGLLCVISPSLRDIEALEPTPALLAWAAPLSFLWVAVEAGLNEEFLFRAVVQTRLTAWLGSPWIGVVLTSILFGLAHLPGLFMRGGPGDDGWSTDPFEVAAYTIAVLSPMGLLFGLIYARTQSLLLVVLLHALVDVLPNMSDFIRIWT